MTDKFKEQTVFDLINIFYHNLNSLKWANCWSPKKIILLSRVFFRIKSDKMYFRTAAPDPEVCCIPFRRKKALLHPRIPKSVTSYPDNCTFPGTTVLHLARYLKRKMFSLSPNYLQFKSSNQNFRPKQFDFPARKIGTLFYTLWFSCSESMKNSRKIDLK